ncbi:hypothetical protein FO519_002500 [Halicephalobus sp. NKZ332]|nr:hypothetical protein FO519_002500 [Halicephalobus sp. NKZ332]
MNPDEIKSRVNDSNWRFGYYGDKPHGTFNDIVTESFDSVKKLGNHAGHCKYNDMYRPFLGKLRLSPSYSELAPTNGMSWIDRHIVAPDLRPYNAYKPKQGEWRQIKERSTKSGSTDRVASGLKIPESPQIPLPPIYRRTFKVPTSCTRHENFARYWGGRARGLEYSQPFFYTKEDNHCIEEDRRYHKLPYAPSLTPGQPTARHGTQILHLPYVTA